MNWDQIEGNWEQAKGKVREFWGKFTDDDITQIKGKKQQLAGKLQEKYGYVTEKAEEEIERFMKTYESKDGKTCSTSKNDCC